MSIENNTTELQALLNDVNNLPSGSSDSVLYTAQTLTEEQKAQARANIGAVGKTELTLGVKDGLIYIFVGGVAIGNGIEQGVSGDVVGYIGDDNTIILTGAVPEGAVYSVKYEKEDGTTIDIGDLSLEEAVEIINQIPISTTDGKDTLFVGTNGEKGYKTGYRISGSSGAESSQTGTEVTGFIPVKLNDTIYMKGITDDGSHIICTYNSSLAKVASYTFTNIFGGAVNGEVVSFTIDGNWSSGGGTSATIAFIRVSATEITADSIVTVNQPIE